ncbi:hypothetical protein DL93DRAFT_2159771 [Clavulina sp. PMI_390]|nr:hypothetical protein DL93DRAFT_2159771 [Clavulina sp. PMI_390]
MVHSSSDPHFSGRQERQLDHHVTRGIIAASSKHFTNLIPRMSDQFLLHLPLDLLLAITDRLDIISLIRLSWVSRDLHAFIALSRSFWVRYCRVLLYDEQLPLESFKIDSLELRELISLATRKERIARATHQKYWLGLLQSQQSFFTLGYDPGLHIQSATLRYTPAGPWLFGLALDLKDNTVHLVYWDTTATQRDHRPLVRPLASTRVREARSSVMHLDLSRILYDPISKTFYCHVVTTIDVLNAYVDVLLRAKSRLLLLS